MGATKQTGTLQLHEESRGRVSRNARSSRRCVSLQSSGHAARSKDANYAAPRPVGQGSQGLFRRGQGAALRKKRDCIWVHWERKVGPPSGMGWYLLCFRAADSCDLGCTRDTERTLTNDMMKLGLPARGAVVPYASLPPVSTG